MRTIAWLLITVSLVVAIVAAVTAYSPKLAMGERLAGLTLNDPAGVEPSDQGPRPLARKNQKLTPELIVRLQESKAKRVRVKEFSLRRWNEWWLFAVGCVGMLAGAMLVRREDARALATVEAAAATGAGPDATLQDLRRQLAELRHLLAATASAEARERQILSSVGTLLVEIIPAFIAARPVLVSRLGLGGYAQLMDRFAAGERQLNRAWSAAADGYLEEAMECLDRATILLDEAEQRLH